MTKEEKTYLPKKVLITGASSGIGKEMARIIARRGYKVILVAKNKEKLKKTALEIGKTDKVDVQYFVCDLSSEKDINQLCKTFPNIDILINNAGFASYGYFHQLPWKREKEMILVNTLALAKLSHFYLKGMVERNFGRILNVASTAGDSPIPFCSTYSGTKAFVIKFSKSLATELSDCNVTVSCLLPGPTSTSFWKASKMDFKVRKSYSGYASPKDVAEFGINLMEKGKISGVPGLKNNLKQKIKAFLPEKIWLYLIRKHMFPRRDHILTIN